MDPDVKHLHLAHAARPSQNRSAARLGAVHELLLRGPERAPRAGLLRSLRAVVGALESYDASAARGLPDRLIVIRARAPGTRMTLASLLISRRRGSCALIN